MTFALFTVINLVFQFFTIVILIDVIASWVMMANAKLPDALYRVLAVVHSIAGIVLNPIRRVIPSLGGLDISPIVALILLQLIQSMLVRVIRGY